ncbi:MAG: hypothetical protein KBE23_07475 [Chloroflexi bacterium]|nr:hypothetical protein [Chloroflexota bacterium]MBP7042569.1 hypothetical protein [Chloroflexota bacterium]
MNRWDQDASLSVWIRQKLATLRQQAEEPILWPETADQLLVILDEQLPQPTIDENVMDMFSLVVQDALSGIDISQRYPTFYGKMMADPALYAMFIDALAMLEADGRQELMPVPPVQEPELAFLKKQPAAQPTIDQSAPGKWRIAWTLFWDQLQALLFPAPDLAFRSAAPLLEDESIILLHHLATIDGQEVETVLEAILRVAQPDTLRLQATAVGEPSLPPLQVTLRWGTYGHTAVLDAYGRAKFPPMPLDMIVDEQGRWRAEDLQLLLETQQT